jgi:hypothetical protein
VVRRGDGTGLGQQKESTENDQDGQKGDIEVRGRSFAHCPALREAAQRAREPSLLETTVERGQVTFAVDHEGKVKYVLVGDAVFTVFQMWMHDRNRWQWLSKYDARKVLEGTNKEVNRGLRRRTYLRFMPRGAVLDLLRGKGNPEEAKRVLAMVELAGF